MKNNNHYRGCKEQKALFVCLKNCNSGDTDLRKTKSVLGEGKNEGLIKTKATRSFKMTGENCGWLYCKYGNISP